MGPALVRLVKENKALDDPNNFDAAFLVGEVNGIHEKADGYDSTFSVCLCLSLCLSLSLSLSLSLCLSLSLYMCVSTRVLSLYIYIYIYGCLLNYFSVSKIIFLSLKLIFCLLH